MMRELKKVNKINLLEREAMIYDEYYIKNNSSYFERFKYNTKLSVSKTNMKKPSTSHLSCNLLVCQNYLKMTGKSFFKNTKKYILKTQKEIETLQQELAKTKLQMKRIRISIFR